MRHPVAARLLTAQLVSELGSFVGLAALILLAFDATHSSFGPALVLASRSLPALFVAGVLGRWLGRPPRRTSLMVANLTGAAAVAVCAIAPSTGTAVVSAALLGATRAAFRSVQAAMIAESIPSDLRLPLLGAAGVINQTAQWLGILVGAVVTLTIGVRTSLLLDIVSYLVAAAVLATIAVSPRQAGRVRSKPLDGVRLVASHPVLRPLAALVLASAFSGSLAEALAPAVADAGWVPPSMAAASAGGAVFTLVVSRTDFLRTVANQVRTVMALGASLAATGLLVMAHGPDWLYVLGNASVGAALGWVVGAQATVIDVTPVDRVGHVEATLVAGLITAGGTGVLLLGSIARLAGPGAAYVTGAVVLTATLMTAGRRLTSSTPAVPE
ncbi:MFS transporter [Mangrovihabitans endophyticus]|uniref:MFS transporter n=1 Tax=Mangrovihabitans endophyticus TaxID=1751298 RepID=UPI00166EC71E|nr:MFS transporter [Mangrovihabitans endophyticus]